jgi:hypothetical protein
MYNKGLKRDAYQPVTLYIITQYILYIIYSKRIVYSENLFHNLTRHMSVVYTVYIYTYIYLIIYVLLKKYNIIAIHLLVCDVLHIFIYIYHRCSSSRVAVLYI